MKLSMVVLLLAASSFCAAREGEPRGGNPREPRVPQFSATGESAMRALLELARKANAPLGIIADDDRLCRSPINYSGSDVPLSVAVQSVVAQVPGYSWRRVPDSSPILITPTSPRPVTVQFLSLIDDSFGPVTANIQTLMFTLWVHVRYILYPDRGTAGSILSSPSDRVFRVEAKNATVEQILNRVAVVSGATWVLRPLPRTLEKLGGDMPFAMFSDTGRVGPGAAELCTPVIEQ